MKKKFRTIKEITDYLDKEIKKAMDKVGQDAWQHMYDYVEEEMNSRPESEVYRRTGEYLNSISKTKAELINGNIEVKIYYNTDLIKPHITHDGTLYQHADDWGRDVSQFIPLWMETGTEYLTSDGFRSHEPVGGIINLEDWVKKNIKLRLKLELKQVGINTN